MMLWTQALAAAAARVARDGAKCNDWIPDAQWRDIQSRAAEFAAQRIGDAMARYEIEYFQCLRTRLVSGQPSHDALQAAWAQAWADAH